jgi:hypothetical protein
MSLPLLPYDRNTMPPPLKDASSSSTSSTSSTSTSSLVPGLRQDSDSKTAPKKKWLVIGIPTVARTNNENYLIQTLEELAKQFPVAQDKDHLDLYRNVVVVVVSMMPEDAEHLRYEVRQQKIIYFFLNCY